MQSFSVDGWSAHQIHRGAWHGVGLEVKQLGLPCGASSQKLPEDINSGSFLNSFFG